MTDKLFLAQADINFVVQSENGKGKSFVATKMQRLVWAIDEDYARDKFENYIDTVSTSEGYEYKIVKVEITPALE